MPIYIKFDGIPGSVKPAGLPAGGVWKTTNFLTTDSVGPSHTPARPSRAGIGGGGALHNVNGSNTWAQSAVQVSRISMTPGGGGVEGRDASARFKVEQLINQARNHGPSGKLYIATDAGVYQNSSQFDGHGRLVVGTDQGIWPSGGVREAANKMRSANNLKQLGLGCHNGTVDIIVTDASGTVVGAHRLRGVSVSGTSGTFTLTFNGQTTAGY